MNVSSVPLYQKKGLKEFCAVIFLLVITLGFLFKGAFRPGFTVASNDGPLGVLSADYAKVPDVFRGNWDDLNWLGFANPMPLPDVTQLFNWLCGPIVFSKLYAPMAIFFVGVCAWICFRQWRLATAACVLGALAAGLNSDFFSTACWGVASQPLCFGFNFLAIAAFGHLAEEPPLRQWARIVLAGCAVGLGVAEAFDIGAIFSLVTAGFILMHSWTLEDSGGRKIFRGLSRLGVVAVTAGLISAGALSSLYRTQIVETTQQQETPAEHWSWATQWSVPKHEVLSVFITGLFGYRMDTPEGGNYWGGIGRDLGWDRYFGDKPLGEGDIIRITSTQTNLNGIQQVNRNGEIMLPALGLIKAEGLTTNELKAVISKRAPAAAIGQVEVERERPPGFLRYSGGGIYAGVLVVLIAIWTGVAAVGRNNRFFSPAMRRMTLFWLVVAIGAVLMGFGRFAPFYNVVYTLVPPFRTMRNPAKFFHIVNWALVMLFALGVDALARRFAQEPASLVRDLASQWKFWKTNATRFDRNCVRFVVAGVILGGIGWMIYAGSAPRLIAYMQEVDIDQASAAAIARFSISHVFWFVLFLVISAAAFVLTFIGYFSGRRARTGAIFMGLVLAADLVRANVPWVVTYNYEITYASNPVLDFLKDKSYLHRASVLPFSPPQQLAHFNQLYEYEWKQHLFQFYNIQSLDVIMMPRPPIEYGGFEGTLRANPVRRWELSNNRYLLGAAGFLGALNQQLDQGKQRFRIVTNFDLAIKPGILNWSGHYDELTAEPKPDGAFAVFEFTGALPRAMLFSNWQVMTNDSATLELLASRSFDPTKTVLLKKAPSASRAITNENPGVVNFVSYNPRKVVLQAEAAGPAVLLLNDKYDSDWKATVDGNPSEILRANYSMRAITVPAGSHQVVFAFKPSLKGLWLNILMEVVALTLLGLLAFGPATAKRNEQPEVSQPTKAASQEAVDKKPSRKSDADKKARTP